MQILVEGLCLGWSRDILKVTTKALEGAPLLSRVRARLRMGKERESSMALFKYLSITCEEFFDVL